MFRAEIIREIRFQYLVRKLSYENAYFLKIWIFGGNDKLYPTGNFLIKCRPITFLTNDMLFIIILHTTKLLRSLYIYTFLSQESGLQESSAQLS